MTERTDSVLCAEWERIEKELSRKNKALTDKRRDELITQQEQIKYEWREILKLKRTGNLTDRTRVDLTTKAAKELSLNYGVRLLFSEREGERDDEQYAMYWYLTATAADDKFNLTKAHWDKFGAAVAKEVLATGPTLALPGWPYYWTRGKSGSGSPNQDRWSYPVYPRPQPSEPVGVVWMINIWVWEGPDGLGRQLPPIPRDYW